MSNNLRHFIFIISFLFSEIFSGAQIYPAYSVTAYSPSSSGYYFTCPFSNSQVVYPHTQMILDDLGRMVYYKTVHGTTIDFKLQPNGMISYSYMNQFFILDSTFTIIDSVSCKNGILTDNHDMQILPNGHFLLLGYEYVVMNLTAYHYFNHNGSPGSAVAAVKCGVIQEQDANKNVVWEWHTKDHFAFSDVDSLSLSSPANVDWTHCNSVELDHDGNILLSSRHFDEITKINYSDSSIIWRLGGKQNQFTFTNDPSKFLLQHDIRRIANGDITLYDNGRNNPFHAAGGKEYQLDENLMTATLTWNYLMDTSHFSQAMGNVQRLSNNTTMVDDGIEINVTHPFDVIDSAGNKIFEISFTDTLYSYRSFNYKTLPWQLPRPQISCFVQGNQAYLDAGAGYTSYLWSNGATTQTIPVTATDTFNVFVPIGSGGFISSDYFVVTNLQNPCNLLLETPAATENTFSIFPDPVADEMILQSTYFNNEKVRIEISDVSGKIIFIAEKVAEGNEMKINAENLSPGIYFIRMNGMWRKFVKI